MKWSVGLIALSTVLALPLWGGAEEGAAPADGALPPLVKMENVSPEPAAFKDSKRDAPLVLRSKEDAAKYFGEEALAALEKQVDFEKQFVLLFAWRGSGQDRLDAQIAESFPEQITFVYLPGRTKDYRPHVHVYALRSNVTWRVQ